MQIDEWSISIENTGLYPLVSKSLWWLDFPTCQTEFKDKNKTQFSGHPLPKYKDLFEILTYDLICYQGLTQTLAYLSDLSIFQVIPLRK